MFGTFKTNWEEQLIIERKKSLGVNSVLSNTQTRILEESYLEAQVKAA
jgi:hypothetical protein